MRHINLIGIDVSESSIKVLQLDTNSTIHAYGSASLSPGVVVKGRIVDGKIFSTTLNTILKNTKPNPLDIENTTTRAILCLPESNLFSHYLTVPNNIPLSELDNYVRTDVQKIIPLELDSLYSNYHLAEEQGVRTATFIGVHKADLDNYVTAFTEANVRPAFVGGELFALGRALLPEPPLTEDYIIMDIGAHSTTIGVYGIDAVANLSILVSQGGEYFTKCLSEQLGISLEEAEKMKRTYGVDASHEDTNVPKILRECFESILKALIESKTFFENKSGNPVKHILVAGGSALLPEICTYISNKVEVETQIANPLSKIQGHELFGEELPSIFYANVIGLALSAFEAEFPHINLLTQYQYDEAGSTEKQLLSLKDIHSLSDGKYFMFGLLQKTKKLLIRFGRFIKKEYHAFVLKLPALFSILLFIGAIVFLAWVVITYL